MVDGIKLTKNNKSIDFIFEVVRREDDWENKLTERMRLYKDFYENFVTMDSGFSIMPQLIIMCEDDRHMAETFKTIITNGVDIPKIKIYFSTDLRQNDEELNKSLVEFKIDDTTGKYKMENIELKILS